MLACAKENDTTSGLATQPLTVIVGMGDTGCACARYLHGSVARLAVMDSREQPPGYHTLEAELPDVSLYKGGFDLGVLSEAACVVLSPGVAPDEPALESARSRGVPIIGDIEIFARAAQAPVLAITGSNGKSTVTSLLAKMGRACGYMVWSGGNLGPPALDLLAKPVPDFYLLELSSFQLETTVSLEPAVATVLNLSPDHLDRHAGIEHYSELKQRIFRGPGAMVLNQDDSRVWAMARTGRQTTGFTLGEPFGGSFGLRFRDDSRWLSYGQEYLIAEADLAVFGDHNLANALAALAMGTAAGFPMGGMLDALRRFRGLPHRCQLISEHQGVRWYNDSKATNVAAAVAALRGMQRGGKVVLIAGGEAKETDFSSLADAVAERARSVVLFGRDAEKIAVAIGGRAPTHVVADMQQAVAAAHAVAQAGDSVLLSPACASFGLFADYTARGECFVSAVHEVTAA